MRLRSGLSRSIRIAGLLAVCTAFLGGTAAAQSEAEADSRRLAQAVKELGEVREALAALLDQRTKADAAKEPGLLPAAAELAGVKTDADWNHPPANAAVSKPQAQGVPR
jgi:hypothetical protein